MILIPFTFSAAFNVLSLNPALWLDASDSSTLYDATSGGSLVAADGTVARWEDKSGNNRHATQATSGNRPIRKTSIKNSKDVLLFDGSNDYMSTVAFGGNQTWTRFIVFASLASQYKVILGWGSSFSAPTGADYMATNAQRLEIEQFGSALLSAKLAIASNTTTNAWLLGSQQTDGTHAGHIGMVNGLTYSTADVIANNPGNFTKASTAYGIGAYNNGTSPANAYIAEVLHFNYALTTAQRIQVETYLNQKYSLY